MVKLMVNWNNLGRRQHNKKKMDLANNNALTDASIEHGNAMQVLSNTSFEYATVLKFTGYMNINLNFRIK